VGLNLRPELVAVKDVNGDAAAFAAVAKQIAETSEFNVILMTEDADVMKAGVAACGFKRPLMYAATAANADAMGAIGQGERPAPGHQGRFHGRPGPLSDKLTGMGLKDLVLDPGPGAQTGQRRHDRHPPRSFEKRQPGRGLPHHHLPL
jgi:acetyl-CoA decarbonylase/synthase complex subunit gamma